MCSTPLRAKRVLKVGLIGFFFAFFFLKKKRSATWAQKSDERGMQGGRIDELIYIYIYIYTHQLL
jgi:hypothetical protein